MGIVLRRIVEVPKVCFGGAGINFCSYFFFLRHLLAMTSPSICVYDLALLPSIVASRFDVVAFEAARKLKRIGVQVIARFYRV